jgi:hypothetical protein
MTPAGFETKIPASKRLQTHALEGAGTGIGSTNVTATRTTVTMRLAGRQDVWEIALKKSVLENLKRRNQFLDIDLHGRKILDWTLQAQDTRIRTALVWVKYGRMLGCYKRDIVFSDSSKAGNFMTQKCVLTSQEIILILRDP